MNMINLFWVILIVMCGVVVCSRTSLPSTSKDKSSDLVAVAVMFRHGDRAPINSFPNDPYYSDKFWPMGFGQLTSYGIRRAYSLGQWIRKRYGNFLSEIHNPKEIYAWSTDVDRTIATAQSVLAGLYPPKSFQVWNEDIPWQPITVHTSARPKDDIIMEKRYCPKFRALYKKAKKVEYTKVEKKFERLIKYIKENTGWHIVTLEEVQRLRNQLQVFTNYNQTFIPEWTKSIYPTKELNYIADIPYQVPTSSQPLARLRIGPFFYNLFNHFENFTCDCPASQWGPKFLIFSCHDTCLVSTLSGMGAYDMRPIGFSDTVIWELRKTRNATFFMFRHGDRSPFLSFPNDPYFTNESPTASINIKVYNDIHVTPETSVLKDKLYRSAYFPMGAGQLTKFGIIRQYKLGQWFRQHYKHFLNEIYSPKEIYVYSTDTDRTLTSAYSNLAGLYPPKGFQVWNKEILWQPIPVHTTQRHKDDIMLQKRKCKKFKSLLKKTKKSKYKMLETKYAELLEYIRKHTGWPNVTIEQVKTFRSNMYTYSNYNKSFVPEWVKSIDQNLLDYLAAVVYELPTATTTLAKLWIGPFFDYLFEYFDSFVKPSSHTKPKFLMISSHDTSIVSILDAMGTFKMRPVNFADTLIWELKKKKDGIFFINLIYKREDDLEQLQIHNCHFNCKYEQFKNSMSSVTINIDDWLKECNN